MFDPERKSKHEGKDHEGLLNVLRCTHNFYTKGDFAINDFGNPRVGDCSTSGLNKHLLFVTEHRP